MSRIPVASAHMNEQLHAQTGDFRHPLRQRLEQTILVRSRPARDRSSTAHRARRPASSTDRSDRRLPPVRQAFPRRLGSRCTGGCRSPPRSRRCARGWNWRHSRRPDQIESECMRESGADVGRCHNLGSRLARVEGEGASVAPTRIFDTFPAASGPRCAGDDSVDVWKCASERHQEHSN